MNRKDRSKARRQWGCKNPAGCGAIFDGHATTAAARVVPGRAAGRGLTDAGPTTLICPLCNTFHFFAADGRGVRLLTPAEKFELYVDIPTAATDFETRRPVLPGLAELHIVPVEG